MAEVSDFEGENVILSAGAIGSPHLLLLSGVRTARRSGRGWHSCASRDAGCGAESPRSSAREGDLADVRDDFDQPLGLPGVQFTLRYTAEGSVLVNDMLIHPSSRSVIGRRWWGRRCTVRRSVFSWSSASTLLLGLEICGYAR